MGKKNKKAVKGKGAEKTAKKTEKSLNKKAKKDGEYEDLEKLLEELQEQDKQRATTVVLPCSVPSPRINFTFTANPDKHEIYLFGGEFDDGRRTAVYNELFVYSCQENTWSKILAPNQAPPRCGHQAAYFKPAASEGELWIFGGEFASPSQTQFYHYRDLHCYHINSKRWEMISDKRGPSARSGHRMCVWKKALLIFGGFQDSGRYSKYFNDLWMFDFEARDWTELKGNADGTPSPRSGFVFLCHPDYRHLYVLGGFAKERLRKDVEKALVFADAFQLTITKATGSEDSGSSQGKRAASSSWNVKWSTIKPCGFHLPPHPRSGVVGIQIGSGPRGLLFGGATDKEEDDETLLSEYHDDLFVVELDKARWTKMDFIPEGSSQSQNDASKTMETIKDGNLSVEEASEHLNSLQVASSAMGTDSSARESEFIWPTARTNVGLAIVNKCLYLFGGMSEECEEEDNQCAMDMSDDEEEDEDEKQIIMNDMYSADVAALISLSANKSISSNSALLGIKWKCLSAGTVVSTADKKKSSEKKDVNLPTASSAVPEPMEGDVEIKSTSEAEASSSHDVAPAPKELVVAVPIILSEETFADYWTRTQAKWQEIIQKEMQDESDSENEEDEEEDDDEIPEEILKKYAKETALQHYRKCKK